MATNQNKKGPGRGWHGDPEGHARAGSHSHDNDGNRSRSRSQNARGGSQRDDNR